MCAIVDKNVVGEVFTHNQSEAGKMFLQWVNSGQSRLVVGGHLLYELSQCARANDWIKEALNRGTARRINAGRVTTREKLLKQNNRLRSNDSHVIALAQLSGARLLYSNDKKLSRDFLDSNLVHSPRGDVYTTVNDESKQFTQDHAEILGRENLCGGVCV